MPDIFLSYSRDDAAIARRFAEGFAREGFSVWWDATLDPGDAFDQAIEKALDEAKAVVVLWSKNSVGSRWVRAEATQANDKRKLVPVMIEPCKRPIIFELTHTAELSHWNGDASDKAWQSFVAGVRRFTDKSEPTPSAGAVAEGARGGRRYSAKSLGILTAALVGTGAVLWGFTHLENKHPVADKVHIAQDGTSSSTASPGTTPARASLAVLPFVDLSPAHDQEYFSDGLSEELLNQLAQIPDLRVIGRTSSFAFKGKTEDLRTIGVALGVNHILEGSVRKAGSTVRITAELINPLDGSQLWSRTYDRDLNDVFAIQEEIAKTVAGALRVSIGALDLSQGGTKDFGAYDAYLSGRAYQFQAAEGSGSSSISRLERAVQIDPKFTVAWVALRQAYQEQRLGDPERSAEWLEKWNQAGDRVIALAPNSPASTLVRADKALERRDFAKAARMFKSIATLPPGISAQGQFRNCLFLSSIAHSRDAVDCWERLVQFEPFAVLPSVQLQAAYVIAGDLARANVEHRRADTFAAGNLLVQVFVLTSAMEDHNNALVSQQMRTISPNAPKGSSREGTRQDFHSLSDDPKRADDVLGFSGLATWAAYFDDPNLALSAIRKTYNPSNGPEITIVWNVWRPLFKAVRRLPEFKDYVREIGLVDYWRSSGNWGDFCKPIGTEDFECH